MGRNLNDVLVFSQVVDAGSFTAAAKGLGLPTSTVSRRVARLEDQLGVRLLQRTTRKLSLTDAGRIFYDRASRIVSELEDAERAVGEMKAAPRGRLRVTAPVEMSGIADLLVRFLHAYPEVNIELDLTNRHVRMVEEGYDVAIRAGELSDTTLIAHRLAEASFVLVASPAYLALRGSPQQPVDLRQHDCIIFAPWSANASWLLSNKGRSQRVSVAGRLAVNHLEVVRSAAVAGLGIAMLPAVFVNPELEAGRLQQVLEGAGATSSSLWVIYPSRRNLPPAVRVFVDFLKTSFQQDLLGAVVSAHPKSR